MRSLAAGRKEVEPGPPRAVVGEPVRRALAHGLIVAGWLFLAWLAINRQLGTDAYAYWAVDLERLYEGVYGGLGFFPYSPAAALVAAPLGLLPWPLFLIGWIGLLVGCLVWLTGSRWPVFLALPPIALELVLGNITLLIAIAIVVGFRWPAAWAFVLLTKVTPGIGLLWFAVRREWRSLATAVGLTAAIAAISYVVLPQQWSEWLRVLQVGAPTDIALPLWPRLPFAAALVAWGALRDRPWTVAAAATVALPRLGFSELSLLVAVYTLHHLRNPLSDVNRPETATAPSPAG